MNALVQFGDSRLLDRFWSKVAPCPMSGCWLWAGARSSGGYGNFCISAHEYVPAHRHLYLSTVGDIEPGLELDHLCRIRSCVNPAHLEPVTHEENVRRGMARFNGKNQSSKMTCPKGHPYAGANLGFYSRANGRKGRRCRACGAEQMRTRRALAATTGKAIPLDAQPTADGNLALVAGKEPR